jgi:hypothetical protein
MPTRRHFLSASGQLTLVAWATAGSAAFALAAGKPEELTLRTLTRMCRLIYPHDGLPDTVYAGIVAELLADPTQAPLLRRGSEELGDFLSRHAAEQLTMLREIEAGAFFDAVRTPLKWALYNRQELRDLIDYPGPSFAFGGYINKGFDDIDWLPTA